MREAMIILVLAAHMICVDVSAGGPLVCLFLQWREAKGDRVAGRAGRMLAALACWLLVAGGMLGLLVGWLLWSPVYRATFEHLAARITYGLWELAFSLVLLVAYAVWWHRVPHAGWGQQIVRSLLPLAAGTNLLYHFPPLFVIVSKLAAEGPVPSEPMTSAEFRQLVIQGDVLARTVHFWMASLAASGVVLMLSWAVQRGEEVSWRPVAIWGARTALAATVLQIPVGLWVLIELGSVAQMRLLGTDLAAALPFLAALGVAFYLIHQLTAVATGQVDRGHVIRSAIGLVTLVVLMTATMRTALAPVRSVAPAVERGLEVSP